MSAIDDINLMFKSGNDIPVTEIRLKVEQWNALLAYIQKMKAEAIRKAAENAMHEGLSLHPAYIDGFNDAIEAIEREANQIEVGNE
jgi:hypothetical protein